MKNCMFDVDLEAGLRQGAFDVAATYYATPHWGAELEFIGEGKQPQNIPNVNRPVNLDIKYKYPYHSFTFMIKGGATSSYFSHNGSGNGYKNNTGFTGSNIGAGLSYKITDGWAIQTQIVAMNYQQSDITAFETFEYMGIGIKYSF